MEVLTMNSGVAGETLPVFSFEEEAELFLRLEVPGTSWRVRESTAGELISILYGSCASVEKVALDPPPEIAGKAVLDLVSLSRKDFLRTLMDKEGRVGAETGSASGGSILQLHPCLKRRKRILEALVLTREEIVGWFQNAGWWVAAWVGGEDALVGQSHDLLILAHESEMGSPDPVFELYDGRFGLSYQVRVVPTPRQAAVLLREHGGPKGG
jgi:hypothetical protein